MIKYNNIHRLFSHLHATCFVSTTINFETCIFDLTFDCYFGFPGFISEILCTGAALVRCQNFFCLILGALLSYFLQPVYPCSITVGKSPYVSEDFCLTEQLKRSLYDRIIHLSDELIKPFEVNKVCEI